MTPERLAELRMAIADLDSVKDDPLASHDAYNRMCISAGERLPDLLQAADNLNALLAAAERAEVEWAFTLGELVKHTDPLEHKMRCEDHDMFRAAIRRAKGEKL